jgi:hypothetical protein
LQKKKNKERKKKPSQKRAGVVAQGISPEFKCQYCKTHTHIHTYTSTFFGCCVSLLSVTLNFD